MAILLFALLAVFGRIRRNFNNPELRAIGLVTLFILFVGTIFYHLVEDFPLLDAFYFSVVTLATVGYGDYVPHTGIGKLFTVIYILLGVGILAGFISILGRGKKFKRFD